MEIPGLSRAQSLNRDTSPGESTTQITDANVTTPSELIPPAVETDKEVRQSYQVPNIRPDLQARIAAMRAQIKQKESRPPSAAVQVSGLASSNEKPSVNFGILDQALADHGFEAMPDSEDDIDMNKADSNSDSDSDSDSDISSYVSSNESDSDDDSVVDEPLTAEEREQILIAADNDGVSSSEIPKTKNEITIDEEPVQVPDFEIDSTEAIEPLGVVSNIIGSSCVVTGSPATDADARVLDCGSLLVFENRKNLGFVADTFGPVVSPMFCVRFKSVQDLQDAEVESGKQVYLVPKHAKYVFGDTLLVKGTDASNIHDEEQSETEFSDDEKEAQYKSQKKLQRKAGREVESKAVTRPLNDLEAIAAAQGLSYDSQNQRLYQDLGSSHSKQNFNAPVRGKQDRRGRSAGRGRVEGRPEVNNYGRGPGKFQGNQGLSTLSQPTMPAADQRQSNGFQRQFYQDPETQSSAMARSADHSNQDDNNVPTLYRPLQRPT